MAVLKGMMMTGMKGTAIMIMTGIVAVEMTARDSDNNHTVPPPGGTVIYIRDVAGASDAVTVIAVPLSF